METDDNQQTANANHDSDGELQDDKLNGNPEDTLIASGSKVRKAIMSGWGSSDFASKSQILIYVQGHDQPMVVNPQRELLLGRGSGASNGLDLAPYDGLAKGVSRTHAALRIDRKEGALVLVDLGSTNGTYLNGDKLTEDIPYTVHDGDAIQLGKLVMHIYFK